jgi:hypothetical protein
MDYFVIGVSIVTFIWTVISFFLLNQANIKMQFRQTSLEKSVFVYNRQFETEIDVLKELSLRLLRLYFAVFKLYPSGLYYEPIEKDKQTEYRKKVYDDCNLEYQKYVDSLYSNAAFIDKNLYIAFDEIRKKIGLQMTFYPDFMIRKDEAMINASNGGYRDSWKKTEEINKDRENIIDMIRVYLHNK